MLSSFVLLAQSKNVQDTPTGAVGLAAVFCFGRDSRVQLVNRGDHCDCALSATFEDRMNQIVTAFGVRHRRVLGDFGCEERIACKRVLFAPHFHEVSDFGTLV